MSRNQPVHMASLRMMLGSHRLATEHGMDSIVFVDEPKVLFPDRPADARIIGSLDADMLGYPAHEGHRQQGRFALSVFHPRVELHYRELVRDLMGRFPGLRYLYVYNQDDSSDNCWPPSDRLGRRFYPKGYDKYPYAAHARLVRILQGEGRKHNPLFRVVTGTWHWFHNPEYVDRMTGQLPPDSVLACLNCNDDRIAVVDPRPEIPRILRNVRARGKLKLVADDDFNGTSDDLLTTITAGFPTPFRTYRKMRRWARESARGVSQHHTGGPSFLANGINDIAWRYFSWHPLVSEKTANRKIEEWMLGQLGDATAARAMMAACRKIDRALDLDERTKRPYLGRMTHGTEVSTLPLRRDNMPVIVRQSVKFGIYENSAWHASLAAEVSLLKDALAAAARAERLAPAGRRPFHLAWKGTAANCKSYARQMRETIEIVMRLKTSMLHFALFSVTQKAGRLNRIVREERANTRRLVAVLKRHRRWDLDGYYDRLRTSLEAKLAGMPRAYGGRPSKQRRNTEP
jgi:hypothetical protein